MNTMKELYEASDKEKIKNDVYARIASEKKRPRHLWKTVLAASLAFVILTGSITVYAMVENENYQEAVTFFEANSLSTEGLTRSDLRRVYRDIKTERFADKKTAEVLNICVNGYALPEYTPTPEEMAELWEKAKHRFEEKQAEYRFVSCTREDNPLLLPFTAVERYDGETLLWRSEPLPFYINRDSIFQGETVIVSGNAHLAPLKLISHIAMLDKDGKLVFDTVLDSMNGDYPTLRHMIAEKDCITAFSECRQTLYVTKLDYTGKIISTVENKITENRIFGVMNAIKISDGYLLQVSAQIDGANFIRLDRNGQWRSGANTEDFTISSETENYIIHDMLFQDGKLYLSGSAVPKAAEDKSGGRPEIASIIEEFGWPRLETLEVNKNLTDIAKRNFTAVLLVCGESGTPEKFYSVGGAIGDILAVEDGQLIWTVNAVCDAIFSPQTSAYTFEFICEPCTYRFDENGSLLGSETSGEIVSVRY